MARRYLGYGYTNSQGVATLEYSPNDEPLTHSYTGVGAGKINIVAQSGSLESEAYALWDTLFYDTMTPYDSTKWTTTLSTTQETDGLVITESSGTSTNFSTSFSAIEDAVIEFDILGITVPNNSVRFVYKGSDNYIASYIQDLEPHHFKIIVTDGAVNIYVDDVSKATKSTTSSTNCRFTINNASVRISNFKIYSY